MIWEYLATRLEPDVQSLRTVDGVQRFYSHDPSMDPEKIQGLLYRAAQYGEGLDSISEAMHAFARARTLALNALYAPEHTAHRPAFQPRPGHLGRVSAAGILAAHDDVPWGICLYEKHYTR